jgi:general secretion pathway protein N
MTLGRAIFGLGLVAGLSSLPGGWNASFSANPPGALDSPSSRIIPDVSVGPGDLAPQRAIGRERVPSGNPLWAVPLSSLSATRERPIFRPSRRQPAPAVLGQPRVEPVIPAATPAAERPQLVLVGAVVGETDGIAVFLDSSKTVIRLRMGQDYSGWVLNTVKGREATLQRNQETAVFTLPIPLSDSAPAATDPSPAAGAAAAPSAAVPAPGGSIPAPSGALVMPSHPGEFAPFVPRKTPKNGEPDGL